MLDERMRIPRVATIDNSPSPVATASDAMRHRLHDEVQDGFANRGETCRVRERSSQSARSGVERPRRTAAPSSHLPRELHEVLRRSRPVPLPTEESQDASAPRPGRRASSRDRPSATDRRHDRASAHAIERVAAAIREMRERGGSGFDGHHPGALVLAGDRGFVCRTWPISETTCPRN